MRFCGECGAPLGDAVAVSTPAGDAIGAQRRHVTVMFCDIVDSTSLAELLDPQDFSDMLGGYHAACARSIERFDGYVAQYQGDGVIAYFGYPRAHEDDPRRAVHASLQILDEVAALEERLRELLDGKLEIRIGLHTGIVVAGEMGTGQARERHAAVGGALHVVARVQALAKPGSIVLTDATLELIAEHFQTEPLGERTLRGISNRVGLHEVVRANGQVPALEPVSAGTRGPMIDRKDELARVLDAWGRARRGHGVLVHIAGEAGIGKSRLVQGLREQVRGQAAGEHILQCSPHHSSTALHPAIRFLEQLVDLDRTQPPGRQLEALERRLALAELDTPGGVPLLADLLSIPGAAGSSRDVAPREARAATLAMLGSLLVGDAASHPLLLVVEDLHWADPTTLELLERVVAGLENLPVECVVTYRTEFEPRWAQPQMAEEIDLGPLSTDDVRAMASASSPTPLDAKALSRVESAADGVPLFVEEMAKALAVGAPDTATQEGRVPPTLEGLLAERLDRLPEFAGLIDVAAVLGREFDLGPLVALARPDGPSFRSALAQLAAEDVLRPVEGSPTRLEFTHALLHEAAYDRLLRRRRRVLHGRVAEHLVTHSPSARQSEPERIAEHWASAGNPANALAYWELAGRRALERAAFLEAAEHFRQGLQALAATRPGADGDAERGELLTYLGAALQAGHTPAASVDGIYAQARSACERVGRRERLIPVIRGQYMFHVARAQYDGALELAEEMLAMGEHGGRSAWLAEGHFYLGFVRMLRGDLDQARNDLEDANRLDQAPEQHEYIFEAQSNARVGALAYLASLLWNQGHAHDALEASDLSLELAEQIAGPVTQAQAWGMRCGLMLVQGRPAEFSHWLEKARAHSVERNIGYWSTVCSIWSAWVAGLSGEPLAATAELERHLAAYLDSGSRVGVPHFQALLAEVLLASGDSRRALDALLAGQERIDAAGERYYEPELQWLTARVLMAGDTPDPAAATAAYERALEAAGRQNAKLLELRAATGLLIHQGRIGAEPTATATVQSLSSWFGVESDVPDVQRARALLRASPSGP